MSNEDERTVKFLKWLEYLGVCTAFLFHILVMVSTMVLIVGAIAAIAQRDYEFAVVSAGYLVLLSVAFYVVSKVIGSKDGDRDPRGGGE